MSFNTGILSSFLRQTPLHGWVRIYRQKKRLWRQIREQKKLFREWIKAGKPLPPPHLEKQRTVKEYANRCGVRVFVETGTFFGEMVYAVRRAFDQVYSIELSMELYQKAKKRFSSEHHIGILQGDSGEVLGELLSKVREPCLFWLDGHYSGDFTAKGDSETPIVKELSHISHHPLKRSHVILIDDARSFAGRDGYPTIQSLREWATTEGFDSFEVRDDIIRILNAAR